MLILCQSSQDQKYLLAKIPTDLLSEWRKIGEKGIREEKKWNINFRKKPKKIDKLK